MLTGCWWHPTRQWHHQWDTASIPRGLFHGGVVAATSMHHSKSTSQSQVWM